MNAFRAVHTEGRSAAHAGCYIDLASPGTKVVKISWKGEVEQIYSDCKVSEIYEGTNEVQGFIIARHLFGKDYTG